MIFKELMLGTAQWGWTVTPANAFRLLDTWLKAGYRRVDCATNYPINRNPADFRAAERILDEYVKAHGLEELRVTMKIGSLDNMRSPESNLAPSFIQMMAEEYLRILGRNLDCLMFHWDNRQDEEAISQSLQSLASVRQVHGIRPGLSGIKFPDIYRIANDSLSLHFDIQLKLNILQSDLDRYLGCFDSTDHRFFAYGINAGGLKLDGLPYPAHSTYLARGGQPEKATVILQRIGALLPEFNAFSGRSAIDSINQLGMIFAGMNPHIKGLLLGVSTETQLLESLNFWDSMQHQDFADVWRALEKVSAAAR